MKTAFAKKTENPSRQYSNGPSEPSEQENYDENLDADSAIDILNEAIRTVSEGTQKHGAPAWLFATVADMWNVYIEAVQATRGNLDERDVAQMMVLLKVARSLYSLHDDNFIDGAGYSALAAMFRRSQ